MHGERVLYPVPGAQMVGIELICTQRVQKEHKEKKLGEMGRSEGIANFLPVPN